MKELRIKIGFVNGQKHTEEEKEILRGTMTVLARVVDEAIYNSVMRSGLDKDLYLSSLERIWYSYEEGDLEKAKEQLYMIASLVDFDAVLEPAKTATTSSVKLTNMGSNIKAITKYSFFL